MPRSDGYLGTKAQNAWEAEDWAAHMVAGLLAKDAGMAALYPAGLSVWVQAKGAQGTQTELLPLSTLISPHTDADFLFRYLNPLSHSSMTSSHLLAQRVLQQSAEKG